MSKDARYPIGPFRYERRLTAAERKRAIAAIAQTPAKMRAAVKGLKPKQLDTPYREGGWTVRQVVHHLPDSHLNAYTRLKLALTEDEPTIKPYDQEAWAGLADTRTTPVETSLARSSVTCAHHQAVRPGGVAIAEARPRSGPASGVQRQQPIHRF